MLEGYFGIDVDDQVVRRFLREFPVALELRTYGEPTVFAPGGLGRASNEGFDAFVPLIDSGISLYVWTARRFLALVVFTCKAFDAELAAQFTRDFFAMSDAAHGVSRRYVACYATSALPWAPRSTMCRPCPAHGTSAGRYGRCRRVPSIWLHRSGASLAGQPGVMMTVSGNSDQRRPVVLGPGEGRAYPMGPLSAVFKADGAETGQRYSISEWWLDPHTKGPGPHSHPEDDVFYVLAGTMSVMVGTEWVEASMGSFVLVPGDIVHDFENRGSERAGMLNVSAPGNFEERMPAIAQWFLERPPAQARI